MIGDPVHEAARLTELSKLRPERLLASGQVVERAGAEADCWAPAGTEVLRGRTTSTQLYAPRSARAANQATV